jgi:hypothetical protein
MYNNNNDAVINNNYGRLRDLILLFKIPMDMGKNFFKSYRQFKHVPSKRCPSPALEYTTRLTKKMKKFKGN